MVTFAVPHWVVFYLDLSSCWFNIFVRSVDMIIDLLGKVCIYNNVDMVDLFLSNRNKINLTLLVNLI